MCMYSTVHVIQYYYFRVIIHCCVVSIYRYMCSPISRGQPGRRLGWVRFKSLPVSCGHPWLGPPACQKGLERSPFSVFRDKKILKISHNWPFSPHLTFFYFL